jgi:hypothetical protein
VCLGVALAWLVSVSLTPNVLRRVRPRNTALYSWAKGLARLAIGFATGGPILRNVIFAFAAASVAVLGVVAFKKVTIDDRFVEFFSPSFEVRQASDFATRSLVGSYFVDFIFDAGKEGGATDPGLLQATDDFCEWLRARPEVKFVRCLADSLKDLNRHLQGGSPNENGIPDDAGLVAQLFLMLELALPQGQDIGNQITIDKSAVRVSAFTPDVSASDLLLLKRHGEAYLEGARPVGVETYGTGIAVMFALVSANTIKGMTLGTLLEILAITLTMAALLKSVRLGVLTLMPNVLPIIIGYAAWALMMERFGMTASVCGAIAIGILVDDTIHLMMRYQSDIDSGAAPELAIARALETSGAAIIITSFVLAAGFLVLGLSDFAVTWTLGYLTALILVIGMMVQLFVFPAMLVATTRKGK